MEDLEIVAGNKRFIAESKKDKTSNGEQSSKKKGKQIKNKTIIIKRSSTNERCAKKIAEQKTKLILTEEESESDNNEEAKIDDSPKNTMEDKLSRIVLAGSELPVFVQQTVVASLNQAQKKKVLNQCKELIVRLPKLDISQFEKVSTKECSLERGRGKRDTNVIKRWMTQT